MMSDALQRSGQIANRAAVPDGVVAAGMVADALAAVAPAAVAPVVAPAMLSPRAAPLPFPLAHGEPADTTARSADSTESRTDSATARFLEFDFHKADAAAVLQLLHDRPAGEPFAYVVTPNVDHVVRLERSRSDLWPAYRRAWLTLCDSRILARMAASVGVSLPLITGSDLTAALFNTVIRPDDRIAILGGSDEIVAELRQRYGLTDLLHFNPPMGFINDAHERARAIGFLIGARARFSILAVGSPQQEIIAYRLARSGAATGIGLCVGASLQFLCNEKSRAPALMQRLSLEWLYRLALEPRRMWRRYLVDGPAIFAIFNHWRRSA